MIDWVNNVNTFRCIFDNDVQTQYVIKCSHYIPKENLTKHNTQKTQSAKCPFHKTPLNKKGECDKCNLIEDGGLL